ncbi:MAG: S8 family peptidase, partial [Candidatus Tenebribacter davisii]|nr:S8 family peptidase [Candidatus Tenebribacter davisii]
MFKRIIISLFLFWSFIIGFASTNFSHQLDPNNPEFKPGEILVKFNDEVELELISNRGLVETGINSLDDLNSRWQVSEMKQVFKTSEKRTENKYIRTYKGETIEVPQLFNIYEITVPEDTDINEAIEEYEQDPNVEFAEPNYFVYTMETYPDDPLYQDGSQWHIDEVNAPAAWDLTTCDTTQVIAIIDTGVDWDHPDLDANIWNNSDEIPGNGIDDDGNGYVDDIRGWDYVNDDNDPNDDNSHGTHVAGIAAAETDNDVGIAGIAWNAKIMPVKMLQSSGYGSSSDLAAAIDYAANNGATAINMSLGSYGESMTVKTALENAYAYSVLVAAAGNDGYKIDPPYPPAPIYAPMYPACYSFVLGIQASNHSGRLANCSNIDPSGPAVSGNPYGHNYEIKAPGVGIYSTVPNGNYNSLSGTSMASPIVSGAVALMKSYNPTQSTEQLFA